jgi:phosphate transport system permease protein
MEEKIMPQKGINSQDLSKPPRLITIVGIILIIAAVGFLFGGIWYINNPAEESALNPATVSLGSMVVVGLLALSAWGLWNLKDWARVLVMLILGLLGLYYGIYVTFDVFSQIFSGNAIVPIGEILKITFLGLGKVLFFGAIPLFMIWILIKCSPYFIEPPSQRSVINKSMRQLLMITALSSVLIVSLIFIFTFTESREAIAEEGMLPMIFGTVWRPGSIIGVSGAQLGMLPMILGSFLSTLGAIIIGVPLSLGTAILLAEIAPKPVAKIVKPAIELLAGIPSVVYGLFGMIVFAPLIRQLFPVPGNSGFGILNASLILAVMIIPTVSNIAEDAIRAVPKSYKEGALSLGATHWQAISTVILPAARSGIVAGIILGIGRALGETMALIMVIGNAIAMPQSLTSNPLTMILAPARTLTGNIAVEINYAAGVHRSALFFSGVLLFVMLLLVNSSARYLIGERMQS